MKVFLCIYATVGCVIHIYCSFCGAIASMCCGNMLNKIGIGFTNSGICLVRQIKKLSLVLVTNLTRTSLNHDR